jgi:hypothetical protein
MPSLYSDAEITVGANVYYSEKSPELAHQEDLRDRSQIHSRVLGFNPPGILADLATNRPSEVQTSEIRLN